MGLNVNRCGGLYLAEIDLNLKIYNYKRISKAQL